MAYNVSIGGVDRTADVISQSISVEDSINDKVNTCKFSLIDRNSVGIPATDTEVIITLDDATKLFGGYIVSLTQSGKRENGEIIVKINCVDYVYLLDRNLAHKSYESMTDAQIIDDLISTYCPSFGITTNNVIEGVTIDQISFNYIQLSQCLRQISDLTGRSWYIDYDKDIHYFPLTTNTAPFNIDSNNYIYPLNENMESTPTGTLSGNASYDSANDWVQFTSASNFEAGNLYYSQALETNYYIYAEFYAGGGSGADANFLYWGASSIPSTEDDAIAGYCVALDEYSDQLQLKFNGTDLTTTAFTTFDNATWHTCLVTVTGTNIIVTIDGVEKINYTDTTRTLGGTYLGVGGRTGGLNNVHRCRELKYYYSLGGNGYKNLNISKDASQLKNRVYVRGGTKLSDATDYIEKGDGSKTKFVLPDKPHNVTVYVDTGAGYVEKTLGVKNLDLTGYDWYLNYQEKYIEQDTGGVVLASTDKIKVNYQYDIPILVAVEDTSSILANGQKEFAIFDKSITTTQAARDRASAELTDYANDIVEGSFYTMQTGFKSGQYININLTSYGVNDDYIIQKVVSRGLGAGTFEYVVEVASSKTMGIIRFLIEMLEANKNLIELDDQEVVDELYNLSDSLLSDSLVEALTIDSAGPYRTWCTDSLESTVTRARWDLFEWR